MVFVQATHQNDDIGLTGSVYSGLQEGISVVGSLLYPTIDGASGGIPTTKKHLVGAKSGLHGFQGRHFILGFKFGRSTTFRKAAYSVLPDDCDALAGVDRQG